MDKLEACPTIRIHGFIGKPGISRADRSQQHVFVNGRPVESKGINYALMEGYHTALMKGKFPVTFLFIEIEPEYLVLGLSHRTASIALKNLMLREDQGFENLNSIELNVKVIAA